MRFLQIGLTVALLLLLDRGVFRGLDYCRSQSAPDALSGAVQLYLEEERETSILVLGSSQALHGFDPGELGESFTIAAGGLDEAFAVSLLDLAIVRGKGPRMVVLTVRPLDFFEHVKSEQFVSELPLRLKYYYGESERLTKYINEVSDFEFLKFSLQCYRLNPDAIEIAYRFSQASRLGTDGIAERIARLRGFEPLEPARDEMSANRWMGEVREQNRQLQVERPRLHFSRARTRYLQDMVELCLREEIQLVLVTLPQLLNQDRARTGEGVRFLNSLAEDNSHVTYIDFVSEPAEWGWDSWGDRYHLSSEGARIGTRTLVERLSLDPLLRSFFLKDKSRQSEKGASRAHSKLVN